MKPCLLVLRLICLLPLINFCYVPHAQGQDWPVAAIKAQPLADALKEFSARTGLQIIYEAQLTAGVTTAGAAWESETGPLAPEAVLSRLLADTGLAYKFINARTLTLQVASTSAKASPAPENPPVSAADRLMPEEVIVTGIAYSSRLNKFEASYALSTIEAAAIDIKSPQGLAELLSETPGIFVESTGGTVGNNVYFRGLPNDNFRYVRTLEDGLPTFEENAGAFTNADIFSRIDETIERVEIVRGGSGAITASNAPGSTVNTLTRKGTRVQKGLVKLSTSDYGLYRADLHLSGPVTDTVLYHVGGYRESDQGQRDPGFTANKGGQVRAGLNIVLDQTELYLGLKSLNDSNTFYTPMPMADAKSGLPGLDPGTASMVSDDFANLLVFDGNGNRNKIIDLEDGVRTRVNTWTVLLDHQLGDHWQLSNGFRYIKGDLNFASVFSGAAKFDDLGDELGALQAEDTSTVDLRYRYVHGDGMLLRLDQLPNGLLVDQGLWESRITLENTINDLRLKRRFNLGEESYNDLMLGFYYSQFDQRQLWNWQGIVTEARHQPRLLDIVGIDNQGLETLAYTDGGIWRHHSSLQNFRDNVRHRALYLTDAWQVNEAWRIDAGARYQQVTKSGTVAQTTSVNLGDPSTLADDDVAIFTGAVTPYTYEDAELAWTLGLNYRLSNRLAFFGRYSNAFRFTGEFAQWFDCCQPTEADISLEEFGIKYAETDISAYIVLFASDFPSIALSNQRVDERGGIVTETADAASRSLGIEWELVWLPMANLELQFYGFYQRINYRDFVQAEVDDAGRESAVFDFSGNRVLRQPQTVVTLRPTLYFGGSDYSLYAAWQRVGSRYVDAANSVKLPSYATVDLGLTRDFGESARLQLLASNLTDEVGVTEGNVRNGVIAAAPSAVFFGRPIFGRSFRLSATFFF